MRLAGVLILFIGAAYGRQWFTPSFSPAQCESLLDPPAGPATGPCNAPVFGRYSAEVFQGGAGMSSCGGDWISSTLGGPMGQRAK